MTDKASEEGLEISYAPHEQLSDTDLAERNLTRDQYIAIRAERVERERNAPKVGEMAPDFEIERLSADGARTGEMFRLSKTRGKPVALIFGSYTWPPFRKHAVRMNEIYETYKQAVDFYLVYIKEAHPTDGWQVFSNLDDNVLYAEPQTSDERAELASVCMLNLGFTIPTLIDNMKNEVDSKYAALPERLYVLDEQGNVFYRGIMGSRGFNVNTWLEAVKEQAAISELAD